MSDDATLVRAATLRDADAIARVHVDSWRETYSGLIAEQFFDAGALEGRRRMWADLLKAEPASGHVVVAARDGIVVGFAFAGSALHPDGMKGIEPARDLHLYSIYLLASEHGMGLGHALLDAAVGDRPAQLWVATANVRARSFYERHGFRDDRNRFADPNVHGLVELRMVR